MERRSGSAADLHALAEPSTPRRTVRVLEVIGETLVLGSTQPETVVDPVRAAAAGVLVTRRRSGGGAVLLVPRAHVWVDLLVPAGDPLWHDDVVAAADWAGEAWHRALGATGHRDISVRHGGLEAAPWSELVCFAGRGPGEVFAAGRKLVGLSQRRTRAWTRIQTAAHLAWEPDRTLDVLALTATDRRRGAHDLVDVVAVAEVPAEQLVEALLVALPG